MAPRKFLLIMKNLVRYVLFGLLAIEIALVPHILILIFVTVNTLEYSERLLAVQPVLINCKRYPQVETNYYQCKDGSYRETITHFDGSEVEIEKVPIDLYDFELGKFELEL